MGRELARRFNSFYGRSADAAAQVEKSLQIMGKRAAKTFLSLQQRFQQDGDALAVSEAVVFLGAQAGLRLRCASNSWPIWKAKAAKSYANHRRC